MTNAQRKMAQREVKTYLETTAKVAPTVNPRLNALIHRRDMAFDG